MSVKPCLKYEIMEDENLQHFQKKKKRNYPQTVHSLIGKKKKGMHQYKAASIHTNTHTDRCNFKILVSKF